MIQNAKHDYSSKQCTSCRNWREAKRKINHYSEAKVDNVIIYEFPESTDNVLLLIPSVPSTVTSKLILNFGFLSHILLKYTKVAGCSVNRFILSKEVAKGDRTLPELAFWNILECFGGTFRIMRYRTFT